MLRAVKRILADLIKFLKRHSGGRWPNPPPRDPYARKPAPYRRGPSDRSTSVAVAEPDEE